MSSAANFGEKALCLLRVAEMRIGSPERVAELEALAKIFSWRALDKKMDELVDRGYVEPLRSGTAAGGLTKKGRKVLDGR